MCFLMAFLFTRIGMEGSSEDSHCTVLTFRLLGAGRFTFIWASKVMLSKVKLTSEALEVLCTTQNKEH